MNRFEILITLYMNRGHKSPSNLVSKFYTVHQSTTNCVSWLIYHRNTNGPLLSTLGRSRIHFEDSRFNISLVTATRTRIQSEDVLHGAHVIDEM
jgi:hypothetical protein